MTPSRPAGEERREFFRSQGVVYLMVESPPLPEATVEESIPDCPTMDDVQVLLMNFRDRLRYETPELAAYFSQLDTVIEALHRRCTQQETAPKLFQRLFVDISGAGIQFPSPQAYPEEAALRLHIAFPGYPFATVALLSTVVRCESAVGADGYTVTAAFEGISEEQRDLVIMFVNHLQRRQLHQQHQQSEPEPS
ncbi:MAG: PilZ domain-containing protein [Deltaproteobacteria bacterium]|nr:PilZ domain-containing protein [Deltaproteobacteria bacterium]